MEPSPYPEADELLTELARLKAWADDVYLTWLAEQASGPPN